MGSGTTFALMSEFVKAVNSWKAGESTATETYEDIATWIVSNIYDLASLLLDDGARSSNIGAWGTSSVKVDC